MSRRQTQWSQAAAPWPRLSAKRLDERRAQESLAHVRAARDLRSAARDLRQLGLELNRHRLCVLSEALELEAALLLAPDERGAA